MSLTATLATPGVSVQTIAAYLDGLEPHRRLAELRRLNRDHQRRLYTLAGENPPLVLADLVPDAAPLAEVIHDGVNTLGVPAPLRRFQKRLCRPTSGEVLFGYNEGPLRRIIGPGYFVAGPNATPDGGVVVDYQRLPEGAVASGWPTVVPNSKGLQRHVYQDTRDYLRRVSEHVTVGAAHNKDAPLDHYFVLCRRT